MVKLSDRLKRLADEVKPGDRVADIGTDHGLLPIFLYENHIASHVILCDINAGPLEKARENIEAYGAGGLADLRRGDGLAPLSPGEADTIIIAGMGGLLMIEILEKGSVVAQSCRRLVLQPRNAPEKLREWLDRSGYRIVNESLVWERKYICEIITAEPLREDEAKGETEDETKGDGAVSEPSELAEAEQFLKYEVSGLLFQRKDRLLPAFLEKKIKVETDIIRKIEEGSGNDAHQRIRLARKRLAALTKLLEKARNQL